MKIKLQAKLALGVGCLVAICDSCQKSETDGFVPHADVPFGLKVIETRQSHEFVWYLDQGSMQCSEQKMQQLWVTKWNSCILEAYSDNEDFDGVNFASSDPSAVKIEKIDEYSCRLIYVSDSKSDVTISGSTDSISHSLTLNSKEIIELESVHVRLGDKDFFLPVKDHEYTDIVKFEPAIKDIWSHPDGGELFTVVDIIPENASTRYVKAWGSTRFLDIDPEKNRDYGPWPTATDERNLDWSEIKGRQFWYSPDADTYLFRVEFKGTDKSQYASLAGRYRWLSEPCMMLE